MGDRAVGRAVRGTLPVGVAATVVALDQAAKFVVRATVGPEQPERTVEVFGSFLAIEYAENRGAAFGLFRGQGVILSALAIAVVVGLALFFRRQSSPARLLGMAIGLIGGGAIGNLVDRIRLGYVVDFIAVGRWPNFNLADSAISIGVALLAATTLLNDPDGSRERRIPEEKNPIPHHAPPIDER